MTLEEFVKYCEVCKKYKVSHLKVDDMEMHLSPESEIPQELRKAITRQLSEEELLFEPMKDLPQTAQ